MSTCEDEGWILLLHWSDVNMWNAAFTLVVCYMLTLNDFPDSNNASISLFFPDFFLFYLQRNFNERMKSFKTWKLIVYLSPWEIIYLFCIKYLKNRDKFRKEWKRKSFTFLENSSIRKMLVDAQFSKKTSMF